MKKITKLTWRRGGLGTEGSNENNSKGSHSNLHVAIRCGGSAEAGAGAGADEGLFESLLLLLHYWVLSSLIKDLG